MKTESSTTTETCGTNTKNSYTFGPNPRDPPDGMPSVLGYFDAIDSAGRPVDLPCSPFDRAKEYRRLYSKVADKRRKKALRQDRLMYEFECLRHHLDFMAESHAELDVQLRQLNEDGVGAQSGIAEIRDIHQRLQMDYHRSQEQADKIMALERKMHLAELKLENEEDRLAEFTEVWIQQADYANSWTASPPQSSPEIALSPSLGSSPATIVGSPVIQAIDAAPSGTNDVESKDNQMDIEFDTRSCCSDEDKSFHSPPEGFPITELEPPSPLDLGSPRMTTPPCPLHSSSTRISVC